MCRLFHKKTLEEKFPPKDENQRKYREEFGGIVDKCLILNENISVDNKLLIYIDTDNNIQVIDWRQDTKLDDSKTFHDCINRLDMAQVMPCENLDDKTVMRFKIMLGAGYNAALHGSFDVVTPIIKESLRFLKERNKEKARHLFLFSSTVMVILSLILSSYLFFEFSQYKEWTLGIVMGELGAFVSIWSRYGKMDMSGLAFRRLHYWESFTRLFCGGIFALVSTLLLKSGLLLSEIVESHSLYACALVGFMAGFNERFIPSILEKMVNVDDDEQVPEKAENKEDDKEKIS